MSWSIETSQTTVFETVKVVRHYGLRLISPEAAKAMRAAPTTPVTGELPRYVTKARWAREKPSAYAITGAWVEQTWDGRRWHERRGMSGLKLNKGDTPSQVGYSAESHLTPPSWDGVPDVVTEFWSSRPVPVTRLRVVEEAVEEE